MKQLKISLPDDLRSQLDAAAEKTNQSLAEEIRSRLEQTFEADAFDRETRELAASVMRMANQIQRGFGSWHQRPKAHEALARAIQDYLTSLKPTLKPTFKPPLVGVSDLFEASLDPQTIGHAVATPGE